MVMATLLEQYEAAAQAAVAEFREACHAARQAAQVSMSYSDIVGDMDFGAYLAQISATHEAAIRRARRRFDAATAAVFGCGPVLRHVLPPRSEGKA
jgi:threonine dehydrogenase-like Zn-dependent dehydrogenase